MSFAGLGDAPSALCFVSGILGEQELCSGKKLSNVSEAGKHSALKARSEAVATSI